MYPTVKVINVPAVTQANGELVCTTTSTYQLKCPQPVDSATFSGVNSHVQAYYGGLSSSNITSTETFTVSRWSTLPGPTLSQVPITDQSTFTETGTATITNTTHAATRFSTAEISFSTPYLHFPSRGKTEVQNTGDLPNIVGVLTSGLEARAPLTEASHTSTEYDTLLADYGYVPQEVIDSLASDYPNLASCLPGGPSILPIKDHEPWINIQADGCAAAAPGVQVAVPDLTTSSGATVKGEGCFHPGKCAAAATSTPAPASSAAVVLPESTASPSTGSREAAISSPIQNETPVTSSKTKPNPISVLMPIFAHSTGGQSASEKYNPTETAEPATNSGAEEVTAGGETLPSASSASNSEKDHPTETAKPATISGGETLPSASFAGASEKYNPTETAKPATSSGAEEVTAGGETLLSASSPSLPAIVFAFPTDTLASGGSGNIITTAGHTLSLIPSASAIEIVGQTLTLGSSAITISGTSVSLGSSGLVIGTTTVPLLTSGTATGATKTTQGLGGIIAGAFGPHESSTKTESAENSATPASGNSTSPVAFLGGTVKAEQGLAKIIGVLGILAAFQCI